MARKKRKNKKNKYPSRLTLIGCQFVTDEIIVTDAGCDEIDYDLVLSYFDIYEIFDLLESFINYEELEEEEAEKWEQISNSYYRDKLDPQTIINDILNTYQWIPRKITIATARAVFNPDYQWVKIIATIDKEYMLDNIDQYELEAIKLGLMMRKELGNENIVIINDNKHAVAQINGWSFFMSDFISHKDFENESKVVWTPRKNVRIADQLTLEEATKIFSPNDDFDDENYDDYDNEDNSWIFGSSYYSRRLTLIILLFFIPSLSIKLMLNFFASSSS